MKVCSILVLAVCSQAVSAITYANVRIEKLTPEFRNEESPQSSRLVIKYGPYQLTPDEEDEVSVLQWPKNATKPCSDCVLKYAGAQLAYQDGTPAIPDNKDIALDSLVLSIEGKGRKDVACETFEQGERILIADSRRKESLYGLSGSDEYGIYLGTEDKMSIHAEMTNKGSKAQNVYLQLTFEYQPGKPKNFQAVKAAWFDAEPCGARPFSSPYRGKWVSMTLHESTADVQILQNGHKVCESQFVDEQMAEKFAYAGAEEKYLRCLVGAVKKGDRIALKLLSARGDGASGSCMGLLAVG